MAGTRATGTGGAWGGELCSMHQLNKIATCQQRGPWGWGTGACPAPLALTDEDEPGRLEELLVAPRRVLLLQHVTDAVVLAEPEGCVHHQPGQEPKHLLAHGQLLVLGGAVGVDHVHWRLEHRGRVHLPVHHLRGEHRLAARLQTACPSPCPAGTPARPAPCPGPREAQPGLVQTGSPSARGQQPSTRARSPGGAERWWPQGYPREEGAGADKHGARCILGQREQPYLVLELPVSEEPQLVLTLQGVPVQVPEIHLQREGGVTRAHALQAAGTSAWSPAPASLQALPRGGQLGGFSLPSV